MTPGIALVALIAIVLGLGQPENTAFQLVGINGFFCMLWALSGGLYWVAALGQVFSRLAPWPCV